MLTLLTNRSYLGALDLNMTHTESQSEFGKFILFGVYYGNKRYIEEACVHSILFLARFLTLSCQVRYHFYHKRN